ncbi:MAG TPA: hypothetical protein VJK26_02450 [Patescibacteria group bacterium]|nr:hypothetical protein [Patescibacteria group bacterium]
MMWNWATAHPVWAIVLGLVFLWIIGSAVLTLMMVRFCWLITKEKFERTPPEIDF